MMPMYEFKCDECGRTRTQFKTVKTRDQDPPTCLVCYTTPNELSHLREYREMRRVVFPHQFIAPDIQPYRAIGPGRPWISSRSEHREYLYKHGYVEVGNDSSYSPPSDDEPHPSTLAPQLEKDLSQVTLAPSLNEV